MRAIILVLLAIIPLLGLTIYSYLEQRGNAIRELPRDAILVARNVAKIQETLFQNASQLFQTLAQLPQVLQKNPSACNLLFSRVIKNHENFLSLLAAYPYGDIFASAPPSSRAINVGDRDWFKKVMQTRHMVIGAPILGRISGRYNLPLAFPVQDPSGKITAVLASGLDLEWLGRFIMKANLPQNSILIMADRRGKVMFRYPSPQKFIGRQLPETALVKTMISQGEGVAEGIMSGVPRLFGFARLSPPFQDFQVAVGIPQAAAFAAIAHNLKRNLIILGLVAMLVMAAAWFGSGFFILRPLTGLELVAQQLAAGDMTVRAGPPYRSGELGLLARDFDRMADAIQERDSRLKQVAAELNKRVQELNAAYKEMESFSYTVAHDLRAPLRAIGGFSRILLEESGKNLDAEGVRYLHIIQNDIRKMGNLIDDLLTLSRLGRREMRIKDLQMEDLARSVFAELRKAEPERNVQVQFHPLPVGRGDRDMLCLVLENLLKNALKFTRPRKEALIEISGEAGDRENIYCVKDNGVGFEMEYVAKLFEVFQRLHPEDEFEGTGMGLAIVQRIIQRHGGRVWAEGKVGAGAKFCFTLPQEEAPSQFGVPGESGHAS
ncbi:MAG: sensor histidine kinase [Thermodesulfobacteriota bacterium]